MLVFVGGALTIGCPTASFIPMLEMVPLVGKTTWIGGFPLGMEATREFKTIGGLWVGRVGMED